MHALSVFLPQDGGLGDHAGDDVGVHVGCRPAVLEVSLALPLGVAADADGRAAVRHALQTPASETIRIYIIRIRNHIY